MNSLEGGGFLFGQGIGALLSKPKPMRINSRGQITIPAELRQQLGFHPGVTVEIEVDGRDLRIVHSRVAPEVLREMMDDVGA